VSNETLLRARIIYPVSSAPIENGAVYVCDGLIHDIGAWDDLRRKWTGVESEDLGEVVLMPGLINAHCHLDYTSMAGMISPPASSLAFPDWIKSILSLKAHWSYTEFADSWVKGAKQLLDSGCTTVLDIEAVPELLPEAWDASPLRVTSFLEMTGVRSAEDPERIMATAEAHRLRLPETDLHFALLSPHALYSTPPELMRLVAVKMLAENMVASIHIAESEAEWEMYQSARGPLYDWLKTQRPMDDCGGRSPVQRANELGLLKPNLLAIHCNYLAPGDAELLAKNHVTVVHCPRSHVYFKHAPFPYDQLRSAGVNIMLGTDSLASVRAEKNRPATLDLWEEMRIFDAANPNTPPDQIIAMVTANIESAVRFHHGSIQPKRDADLITISYSGDLPNIAETFVHEPPQVLGRWIAGKRV
jgi:cytosine/adenosine deaminase-related metal-dependent hydrolase